MCLCSTPVLSIAIIPLAWYDVNTSAVIIVRWQHCYISLLITSISKLQSAITRNNGDPACYYFMVTLVYRQGLGFCYFFKNIFAISSSHFHHNSEIRFGYCLNFVVQHNKPDNGIFQSCYTYISYEANVKVLQV